MIVVDTTVLIYAVGAEHPLAVPCRQVMTTIGAGQIRVSTTVEVIQEFLHVRSRRRTRKTATGLARRFATAMAPLLAVDSADLDAGLDLFERVPGLGAFDAVLAAAARNRQADALISADRAFADVPGLRHLNPADPTFATDLDTMH